MQSPNIIVKKTLDEWLDSVNYGELDQYTPSKFALTFMNFIKLVNGKEGESNKTPPVHLKMLDKLVSPKRQVANLCFRGAAKTTLFFEYLSFFIGVFGYLPDFGDVSGMMYVSDSMDNGVKSARKNVEFRYYKSDFLQDWLPPSQIKFTDAYIEMANTDGHLLGIKMFGAKTGIRGTKIFGKRPVLAVLDDLVSDDDAKSQTQMNSIKDTVHKGINYALDPQRRKTVFNGTPFNTEDILIEAVESGAWDVNVWPVCEKFPCTREEFKGAWPDRFDYDFVKEQYDNAVLNGKLEAFYQELMLRISSEDSRLVQDQEIRWYKRTDLLGMKGSFNFYITTDFATSTKQTADYSVISVWAYNHNGDWYWVDGWVGQKTLDNVIDRLFQFVIDYNPQQVGIEVSGQQGGFIAWIKKEMMSRNIWFTLASNQPGNQEGIRPLTDKLSRFNLVVPLFKAGKIFWPEELKTSDIIGKFMSQIRMATSNGLKGKDDCIDTISMLAALKPYAPAPSSTFHANSQRDSRWDDDIDMSPTTTLSNYLV